MSVNKEDLNRCQVCFALLLEPFSNLALVAQYLQENNFLSNSIVINEDNKELKNQVVSAIYSAETYAWSDDSLKTSNGYAGVNFKGLSIIKPEHIIEIQNVRKQQEIDSGIEEANRTIFTEVDITRFTFMLKDYIEELRVSTEKILIEIGQSKLVEGLTVADLDIYFNYDEDNNKHSTMKFNDIIEDRSEWIDVDRIQEGFEGQPKLPLGFIYIKNIHIEDLRHFIPLILVENFSKTSFGFLYNFYGVTYATNSGYNVVKREGDYLAIREGDVLDFMDFKADLTSSLYPEVSGNKFTWSLTQLATPRQEVWPGTSFDTWTDLIYVATQMPQGYTWTMNCSNTYIKFVNKNSGQNKDVEINTEFTGSASFPSAFFIGSLTQGLKYTFNSNKPYKINKDSKVTFSIADYSSSVPPLGAGDIFPLQVRIPVYDINGNVYFQSAFHTLDISANGSYEFLFSYLSESVPYEFYLKEMFFNTEVRTLNSDLFPTPRQHLKLVTPIKIIK